MPKTYFTVGPSELHPDMSLFLQKSLEREIGSLSHRSSAFQELYATLSTHLKKLFSLPDDYLVFYSGTATEFMELIVQNCSSLNTFHFVDGAFSCKFRDISRQNHRLIQEIPADHNHVYRDMSSDLSESPELICLTHNETSNGVVLEEGFLEAVRRHFPESIIALDIVSSAPTTRVDLSQADCIFFSVQKGFGLPAGLGVMLVSPRAIAKSQACEKEATNVYRGSYHSFTNLAQAARRNQTVATPNVLGMFLLNEVVEDFLRRGISTIREETAQRAALIYSALERAHERSLLKPLVDNPSVRSQTVIVAEVLDSRRWRHLKEALEKQGLIVGAGYGSLKEKHIRIGNFPAHSIGKVNELCEVVLLR